MRAFHCLVNPLSGGGAAPAAIVPVARILRDAGARVEVTYSPGPVACAQLARESSARGDVVCRALISTGGRILAGEDKDGIMSAVANINGKQRLQSVEIEAGHENYGGSIYRFWSDAYLERVSSEHVVAAALAQEER